MKQGIYFVQETNPAGHISVGPDWWAVHLLSGAHVPLAFADRLAPATATPTPTRPSVPTPTATTTPTATATPVVISYQSFMPLILR